MTEPRNMKHNLTGRKVTSPIAALTMAILLFVYARTSIQAAKRNAQKHREADGGQINWHNESLRRHGKLEPPEQQGTVSQIVGLAKENVGGSKAGGGTETEKLIRERVAGKGRH
ncbi:hypothetical protein BJ875DRAFT_483830 [Amylocarpus encephaloides]|uniref:Uncharacterized protein n=1 Tax=Amylocarpus encephaloides TaxID=45428 RepID=A0A9P8C5P5_9HELO|nr:hypothetical protein BJ875DRAFT_483830 [Amylocarpus encephaloides]